MSLGSTQCHPVVSVPQAPGLGLECLRVELAAGSLLCLHSCFPCVALCQDQDLGQTQGTRVAQSDPQNTGALEAGQTQWAWNGS